MKVVMTFSPVCWQNRRNAADALWRGKRVADEDGIDLLVATAVRPQTASDHGEIVLSG